MATSEQYSIRIADYIYNDMDAKERRVFEEDLKTDEVLAREYRQQLKMVNYLKEKARAEELVDDPDSSEAERLVKEYMTSFPEDFVVNEEDRARHQALLFKSRKPASITRYLYPLLAAAVLLVAVMIIRNDQSADQGTRLYSRYYRPMDEAGFIQRGTGGQEEYREFNAALGLYQKGNYSAAGKSFSELSTSHPEMQEAMFFLGLSKMGEEDYSGAAVVFNNYLSVFDRYGYETTWYLALCYLRLDQPEQSRELLGNLTNVKGEFGRNASGLLKRLDKLD